MVDDGTHCNDDSGACVNGVCESMPQYVAPTTPPPTNGQGKVIQMNSIESISYVL